MKISLFTYWFTWRQRPHHLVDIARKMGHTITVYSNRSVASFFSLSRYVSYGQEIKTNLLLPSPRFDRIPGVLKLNSLQRKRLIDDFLGDVPDVHIFAAIPTEQIRQKPRFLIYDCMDDWSDFPSLPPSVSANERRLCQMADRIWVVSEHIYRKFEADFGAKLEYVPNGVDYAHFYTVPQKKVPRSRPVLGYVGALHSWFDAELVACVADQLPEWDVILVGPNMLVPEQQRVLSRPNIHFAGRQPYERVPALLAEFDVAMIPFILNDLIKGTSPIKLYEYLAAGIPVVSSSMPEVIPFCQPGVVACADEPYTFARAVKEMRNTESPAMIQQRQVVAQQHTWEARFKNALSGLRTDEREES